MEIYMIKEKENKGYVLYNEKTFNLEELWHVEDFRLICVWRTTAETRAL